ncbi:MAG: AsmA family protein, partial [Candidatus Azobacteroides sp.]|nr:AsmA family protein [Candidatus Azobacteroides sp.]
MQIAHKTAIKKVIRIACLSILSLCVLVLSLYFLLQLSPVQQKIKELALQEIMKKTKNKISIGNLRFRPFNSLQLEEVYATDLKNDTLLYVEKLNAKFNLFKLLRKQFIIHSVELDRFDLHISKDSLNAPFNFQFFVDAFASDTTQATDNSKLKLAIDHILLKDGNLRYDVFSEPFQTQNRFDVNHIDVGHLQFDAKLHYNDLEDWSGSIENLSLNEKSGFALKQLKFQIKNLNNHLQIDHFYISLPHSESEIQEATLDYAGLQLNEILSGAAYSIPFTSGKWYPCDFSCFYPELARYTDTITCSGNIKGKLPEISLPHFEMNYGKQIQLALNARIADFNAWKTSPVELKVEKCKVDPESFGFPLHTDTISLTGKIAGSLPDLKLALTVNSQQGNLEVNGTGEYMPSSGNARFDLSAESSGYNIKSLLSDSTFGNVSFQMATQGTVTGLNKIEAKADAEIHQFDFQGYSYRDITASAAYANDSVSIDLISKDHFLPLILQGKAGLDKKNSFLQLYAHFNGVRPDVLNLLPQYQGLKLSGTIHANTKGFDPEKMTASVAIDNLHWTTPSDDFNASPVTISYVADADRQKQLNLRSPFLNIRAKGDFSYNEIMQSFMQTFPALFSSNNLKDEKKATDQENFDFVVGIHQANTVANLLGMEANIPDSALFIGKYNKEGEDLNLNITAFCIFDQTDTARVALNLSNMQDDLNVQLDVKNKSNQY